MADQFHIVQDGFVILRDKTGVYRQAKLYQRAGFLYAGYGSGFIKLFAYGTSNPNVSMEDMFCPLNFTWQSKVGGAVLSPKAN